MIPSTTTRCLTSLTSSSSSGRYYVHRYLSTAPLNQVGRSTNGASEGGDDSGVIMTAAAAAAAAAAGATCAISYNEGTDTTASAAAATAAARTDEAGGGIGFGLRLRRVKDFVSAEEWTLRGRKTAAKSSLSSSSSSSLPQDNAKATVEARGREGAPRSYDVSAFALKGGRISMEDEYCVDDKGRFAGVFDGHGGGGVSGYLRERLYDKFQHHHSTPSNENAAQSRNTITSQAAALRSAFDEIDKEVCANDALQYQGSTAVAVVVHEDEDNTRTLLAANIGDSRAILCRRGKAVDLTRDHKPNDEREKARILGMGETIEWDHYCKVHRVRNLSLSRAIGDRFAKPAVSGEVEIKRFPVIEDVDEFVVLASDGLWDVMTSHDVVSFVHKRLSAPMKLGSSPDADRARCTANRRKNMSRFLSNEAIKRGSGDNVCVVMIWLNKGGDGGA
eukprot:CAMPEP_0178523960 /NCGR_PEP_ID=MMETSP0696-20121128/29381_1 /TAXON_ID=265572 /ORGANISM="Extubocellulus spinifer, Strain CCMP396" /LENGTH=446 /DNA_ID=CAMNT_0020155249 /DNA_START=148 /DNA_END=1488 /DNA_ORIENTATION=-